MSLDSARRKAAFDDDVIAPGVRIHIYTIVKFIASVLSWNFVVVAAG